MARRSSARAAGRHIDREPFKGFAKLFSKGTNIALVGPKESGKSWTISYFVSLGLRRRDYIVASNILCQRWIPAEDDPERGTWAEAYPQGYHKVNSFYRLFWVIENALRTHKTVLFVLDEAGALAKGMQAGETRLSPIVRDNLAFMAVSRHLNVCSVVMAQSLDQIGTGLRSYEGGILDYVIRKPSKKHKELVQFENVAEQITTKKIGPLDLAHPMEWAMEKPGRIIYADSMSAFDRGYYPGTRTGFRLRELLDALSDQLPDRYPEIIREHLEWRAPSPSDVAVTIERVESALHADESIAIKPTPHNKKDEIVRLLKAHVPQAAIHRQTGASLGTISGHKKNLVLRGELDG